MISSSSARTRKGHPVIVILLLIVFLVIFTVAAFVSFPKNKAIELDKTGPDDSMGSNHEWYRINEGSYQVLNEFGEIVSTDSTFLYPKTYYYFNVLVKPSDGEDFVMAVRTYDKTDLLREGDTPELCGMISDLSTLDDSKVTYQLDNPGVSTDRIYMVCLNDNDIDVSGSLKNSILFGLLALADIFLIIRILLVNR